MVILLHPKTYIVLVVMLQAITFMIILVGVVNIGAKFVILILTNKIFLIMTISTNALIAINLLFFIKLEKILMYINV